MGYNRQQTLMRKKLFIFLLAVLTGTGTLFAQSSIGEIRIWPLPLDDELRDMYSSQIVYDLSPDDTESFLYIWENTYTVGTASIQDGNSISLTVADKGWAGESFSSTGQVAEAVRSLRDSIVGNPEQYYLHLSVKSSDTCSHCFYVFNNTDDTKFVLGNHSVYDGPVLQDFPRDGEWHDIIVPMSPYASALASVDLNYDINVLVFLSEGVQGAELSLRNVYFYTVNPLVKGNYTVYYMDKDSQELTDEMVTLHVPTAPVIEGFTFVEWRVVEGSLLSGITIQAVYEAKEPTSAPAVYSNPANPAQKLIRNGNVYILTDDKVYTVNGARVK